jgi:diguanylate cyclase (GGDEF)-like protein
MRPVTSGILLEALSVTMYSTGMVLEKLATRRLPSIHARRGLQMVATLTRDPLWLLGFALLVLGLGTQVLALTLAPISIVQAVAACGIALFLVLSHFVLGERLTKFEYVGIVAILSSLFLLGLSVDSSDDVVTGSTSLWTIFGVGIPAVMVGAFLFLFTDRLNLSKARSPHLKAPLFGLSSGLLYGVAALGVKEVSTIVKQNGLFDGTPRVLESPAFYLFLASTVLGFLVFQTALQRTTASVFVPVNNVTSSCYFIIAGTVLFHERLPKTGAALVLRLGAFAMILLGLLILAVSRSVVSADTGQLISDNSEGPASESDVVTEAERVLVGHDGDDDAERDMATASAGGSEDPRGRRAKSVELMLKEFSLHGADAQAASRTPQAINHDQLWQLSMADPHTGLLDQLFLIDRLAQALKRRRRHGGEVVVCHISLDNLPQVNLDLGYTTGNTVLCEMSRHLARVLRTEDNVSRVGRSELVVVTTVKNEQAVGPLIRRIQHTLDEEVMVGGRVIRLRSSLGVAIAEGTESAEDVLKRAKRSTRVGRRLSPDRNAAWYG